MRARSEGVRGGVHICAVCAKKREMAGNFWATLEGALLRVIIVISVVHFLRFGWGDGGLF